MEIVKQKNNLFTRIKKEWSAYLFILPSISMFLLFVLYPMFLAFVYSFQRRNLVNWEWAGFSQYVAIFSDPFFVMALRNTTLFVVILVPIVTIVAFLTAQQVAPLRSGFQVFFRAVFYIPVVTSSVIVSLVWLWIFNPSYGLLNYAVTAFGGEPVVWLASEYTVFYLMFVVFTFNFGVPFIIYVASMGNIPPVLYEVARIDGAKKRTVTWRITFPLLKPVTFFVLVTQTIFVFQVWVVIQLLTNGGPARSTETIVFQLYKTAFWFNEFGRASAMGVVLLAIIVVVAIVQRKLTGEAVDY